MPQVEIKRRSKIGRLVNLSGSPIQAKSIGPEFAKTDKCEPGAFFLSLRDVLTEPVPDEIDEELGRIVANSGALSRRRPAG
jgi:hypothetical protein